jgi:tetratricopeptide (TPR) repeat protein
MVNKWLPVILLLKLTLCISTSSLAEYSVPAAPISPTAQPTNTSDEIIAQRNEGYVGSSTCKSCHAEAFQDWQHSHHAWSMLAASSETVMGKFDGRSHEYAGILSTFYKKDQDYIIRTGNAEGKLEDFKVVYTFGLTPLQQYVIEFDKGAYQVASLFWDDRLAAEGGQVWRHIYEQDQEPVVVDDPVYWTGVNQNWNHMCAECHSTNLVKGYKRSNKEFNTTWSEINVGCEACHGPGKGHLQWTSAGKEEQSRQADHGLTIKLDERKNIHWKMEANGIAYRSKPNINRKEMAVCGRCHARRSSIAERYEFGPSLLDSYIPSTLDNASYHVDGQQKEEVYVWGNFSQSKMFHKQGVTCSDCHNPHSLQLKGGKEKVCFKCHSPEKYAQTEHHHHNINSSGSLCVDCHMPATNYMVVDSRNDHSIRIPRPDRSVSMGVPNACNQCHTGKSADWALASVKNWYGKMPGGADDYAEAFFSASRGHPEASSRLLTVIENNDYPPIVRASALSALSNTLYRQLPLILQKYRNNAYDLIRFVVARASESLPAELRHELVLPLLDDKVGAVRMEAARSLASISNQIPLNYQSKYKAALTEYKAAQQLNLDRPESQFNLALLASQEGDLQGSEFHYGEAIDIQPGFFQAYINLADLKRVQGQEQEVERILRELLSILPEQADASFALAMTLIRQQRKEEAMVPLAIAATKGSNPYHAYVYSIALLQGGEEEVAVQTLKQAQKRFPGAIEPVLGLYQIALQSGQQMLIKHYYKLLHAQWPGDPRLPVR